MTLEKLQIIIEAQTAEYMKALQKVQNQTNNAVSKVQQSVGKVKSVFSKLAKTIGIALSVTAIVAFGKECINLGSDLAEVQNVVDVTFGELNKSINTFAKNAIEKFGLSELAAKQYSSTMGAMLKSMGFANANLSTEQITQGLSDEMKASLTLTGNAAADMSMILTGLAGDMASFYNLDASEAFAKIRAGISGETEPLKQLGINLSVANLEQYALTQGITKSYSAMTQQEQALLRYNYLLSVTSDAQGDFSRTSDGWANQVRILTERFNSLKATIGQGLINVLTPVITVLNTIIDKLQIAANAFQRFTEIITGKKNSGSVTASLGNATDSAGALTEATTEAGNAAGAAAKKYAGMSSLDELNVLSGNESGGTGTASSDTGYANDISQASEVADSELNPVFEKLANKLREIQKIFSKGFFAGLGSINLDAIIGIAEKIKAHFISIFEDGTIGESFRIWFETIVHSLGQVVGSYVSVGATIAINILGGLRRYLDENIGLIQQYIVNVFDITSEIAVIKGNFAQALADIWSVLGKENGQTLTANLIGIFANSFIYVTELCGMLARDVLNAITKPFIDNKEGFKTVIDDLLGVIAISLETVKTFLDETAIKVFEVYEMNIRPFLDSLAAGISTIVTAIIEAYNTYIAPTMDLLTEKMTLVMNKYVQPLINRALELIGQVATLIQTVWQNVLVPLITYFIDIVGPVVSAIMTVVGDVFVDAFSKISAVANGIMDVLSFVITFLTDVFSTDWKSAWENVKNIFKGMINGIITIVEKGINKIISGFNSFLGGFNGIVTSIGDIVGIDISIPTISEVSLPRFKTGGFPEDGLFMANSSELVGSFNGKPAVVNNQQIIEGVSGGVQRAVEMVLAPYLQQIVDNTRRAADKDFSVNIGDKDIARANRRGEHLLGAKLRTT